jgi:DNA-binding GntR family transcriptional regulator/transposase
MDNRSLDALTRDENDDVRQRAQLVRDTLSMGPVAAAQRHGVTRQTATKWTIRYQQGGVAQLQRSAHRRHDIAETRRAVLSAPLWMPTPKWSSRSIAVALGVSQSYVARTWEHMRSRTELVDDLEKIVGGKTHELLGFLVTPEYALLVLRLSASKYSPPGPVSPAIQRSLRTVLAADLVRESLGADQSTSAIRSFWDQIREAVESNAPTIAIASRDAPIPPDISIPKVCENSSEWQSVFSFLIDQGNSPSLRQMHEVETELRKWYRDPRSVFSWTAPKAVGAPDATGVTPDWARGVATRSVARHVSPERALADEIVATIRQGVADGYHAGGDRVTERYLAGRLRTTRGQVRSALRLLERDGLLTITTGRAAVVPIPTLADVVETYAARRALGALMVRAAVRWTPEARKLVIEALQVLEQCAASGDVYMTGQADIDFQNALAEASGLARIGPMLQLLGEQLRMFIAVMGLAYAFPSHPILVENRQIFAAIDAGDEDAAVERWRSKMDDAVAYMLRQLQNTRLPYRRLQDGLSVATEADDQAAAVTVHGK